MSKASISRTKGITKMGHFIDHKNIKMKVIDSNMEENIKKNHFIGNNMKETITKNSLIEQNNNMMTNPLYFNKEVIYKIITNHIKVTSLANNNNNILGIMNRQLNLFFNRYSI